MNAKIEATSYRGTSPVYAPSQLIDDNKETYWATDDDVTTADIELDFERPQRVKYVLLQEYIPLGQRVKSFEVEVWKDNAWQKVASATTIGYKRILKLDPIETQKVRIRITGAKACPVLSNLEVY